MKSESGSQATSEVAHGSREALESDLEARCISVVVAGAHYAMHLDDVQEVIGLRPLTRVFHSPAAIAGVTSLRGDVLPVLDLGVLLGAGSSGRGVNARVLVVRDGSKRRAGLLVDALAGLREIPEAGLEALPSTLSPEVRELSEGVIADSPACVVLRVSALLSASQITPTPVATGAD
ncbi:MAG: chemotaxis protein CheW [Polyangiaceae bacterium]